MAQWFFTLFPSPVCAAAGFVLDLIFGDPRWLFHPVRIIGKLISFSEKLLRKIFGAGKERERAAGIFCAALTVTASTGVPAVILFLLYRLNFWAGFALDTFWCAQLMACGDLKKESMRVYYALKTKGLDDGRRAVSMIVGRDTDRLDEKGVIKAAVETVAENTSDGVTAPAFYMMIFGAAGGFFYKSVNTMDSMIGYRNDRYRYFGTAAARLDDVLNFIPSRITGILMCAAAGPAGFDGKNAWKIFRRDRLKSPSPNSAQTESAAAGALDIALLGDAWYFGELHRKDTVGDDLRPVEYEDIPRACRLMMFTSVFCLALFSAARIIANLIFL